MSTSVPHDLADWVAARAAAEHRTVAQMAWVLLDEARDAREAPAAAAAQGTEAAQ